MKDHLLDIVQHTHGLGVIDLVKITGTDSETQLEALAEDRSVIVQAKFKGVVAEFVGTFGMPNLGKLNTILNIPEYKENAQISAATQDKEGVKIPVGVHFENKTGDFKNDYRFMSTEIINEKMKTVKFRGVKWDVEVEPTVNAVQRFNFQAGANNEHPTFLAKTESGNLKFIFGDASTHGGEFIFAQNVAGKLDRGWTWPVAQILSILKIADVNNTKMSLSNEGAIQITLDSGLATYKYIIPAQAA